ncbi:DUF4105 domain-containing protein [Psychrobacter sp. CAL346-MNA-CIBAN-0220]|uniref:Lnb N-terminal periplasmic domain-containing protein n=1 Tax=Psychrobacter sp. CAL346-MNA-CIBAN-0220 TaxID=3140457 RepID=UPI003317A34A
MSPRSFFSQLFSLRKTDHNLANRNKDNTCQQRTRWHYIVQFFIVVALLSSAVWLLMAIWYQFGSHSPISWLVTAMIVSLLTSLLTLRYFSNIFNNKLSKNKTVESRLSKGNIAKNTASNSIAFNKGTTTKITATKWLFGLYTSVWLIGVGWFISITPQQQRDWQPDVSQRLSYQRDSNNPDLITFTNVRNFDWHSANETNANKTSKNTVERWESRTVDLSKLSGVDVINSYWMGPLIAHTLVSFRFEDDRPLSFSLEIRKENGEYFSALGGFFKRFELSLIAAEERDIIYTRTNVRGEQVYLFPVSHLQQREIRSLFESYLTVADELNTEPAWYNTLTSNCTNIIFYMARIVSGQRLPWDYRIWVSGWLPNYLYDIGMLDAAPEQDGQPWSMDKWYEQAHINPKVKGFVNQSPDTTDMSISDVRNSDFSTQIRQGIPIPLLADSHAIRVNPN